MSDRQDSRLVERTFIQTYKSRGEPYGLMFHSDRGCQYTSGTFRQLLDRLDVVQSFSRKGCPFDNAVAESFFRYLKQEETNRRKYKTVSELKVSLFEYIEGFYNSRRPHGTLHYKTPNRVEKEYEKNKKNSVA